MVQAKVPEQKTSPTSRLRSSLTVIGWIFALVFPLVAISQQSFWIDEAITGNAARQPVLRSWWQSLVTVNGSDLQMPFYMLYVWAWEKIFGSSEIFLRLANYPWFLLGQMAGAFIWRDRRKGLLFIVIAACNSFIWFYLNEARPYIMQYGLACVIVYFLCSLARSDFIPLRNYWLFSLAIIALAGANMLGSAWSGMAVLVAGFFLLKKQVRPPLLPIVFCIGAFVILGYYYVWTLVTGAFGSRLPTRLILNIFYVPYELCGFAGLGPGRLDIREHGLSSFWPFLWPLAAFALVWLFILLYASKPAYSPEEKSCALTAFAYAIPPIFFLFLVGLFINFNVLGRHAIPAMPFMVMLLTLGIWSLMQESRILGNAIIILFGIFSVASCLGVRFFPWHARDDYRGAAVAISKLLVDRQMAWWCASWEAADYYKLPIHERKSENSATLLVVRSPTPEQFRNLPSPSVVVLSKPDIYDSQGTIAAMLKEKNFTQTQTLQAFSIWEKR